MCFLHIITFLAVINAYGYLCFGIPAEKGLIIGTFSPPSVITVREIPISHRDYFNNALFPLSTRWSRNGITSDPKKKVVFFYIGDTIYEYQNFSIWQQLNISHFSKPFKGRSPSFGQIAFDYVSNNLYWCDAQMKWIAMKPAYKDDNLMLKIVVHNNLGFPQGLALDPEEG
ncbi:uncharacterized protein LOC134261668 [Saccostrea cucullata]|uniref:uncharacterized protein LOC134249635 n=1 Tax=Saccostrea cuccullata TaxID=36930 RepID=UPI002ED430AD